MSFETGFFVGTDPSVLSGLSSWLGKSIDVMNWQLDRSSWTNWLNSLSYSQGKLAGVTTQINYTVPLITTGASLSTAASHGYDNYYVQAAKALLAISGGSQSQIVVRVGEEFNGSWMPWAASGHEADFAQAYRNFVDAFRSVSNKFVFEWNVAVGASGTNMTAAYPGDKYVDIISGDLYWDSTQSWSVKDPTQAFNYYASTTNGLNWLASFAAAHGKPTALSEWGVNSDNAAPFIQDVYNWLTTNHAVYESYWNSTSSFNGMLSNGQYPDAAAEFLALFGGSGTSAATTSGSTTTTTTTAASTATSSAATSSATIAAASSVSTVASAISHGVKADFTGDGRSDLLFVNGSGGVSLWSASTDHFAVSAYVGQAPSGASFAGFFDFDGDGKSDVLWQFADGHLTVTPGAVTGLQAASYVSGPVDAGWSIVGLGDMNGDGKDDILWRNVSGALSVWSSTGSGFQQNSYYHAPVSADWSVQGLGDFNGDGKSDILWRSTSGAVSVWSSTGSGFQEAAYYNASVDKSWHVEAIGDFDGDGKSDILWRNENGAVSVWLADSKGGFTVGAINDWADTDWHIAQVGDFNGDGKSDIMWRSDSGTLSEWDSTGSAFTHNTYYNATVTSDWTLV